MAYIKNIYKFITLWTIFLVFFWISFSNYDIFLNNLKNTGIPIDEILETNQISRYEVTRLLNTVNCEDCVNTPDWMLNQYANSRWLDFSELPWKDFNDIIFEGANYNKQSYYYCVAYVWDNGRMKWYPAWVSPICDGSFCGYRNITIWEFLQVVLNIADQYVYNRYLTNWSKIKIWMDSLKEGTYPYKYLNQNDRELINRYAEEWLSWILPNEESLHTYIKYCMFNNQDCGMQSFGQIKEWYWPIWELNILYDHNIVEYEKFKDGQIHELADGEYVLKTLYALFQIVDCNFDFDYDCDGIPNHIDNCPNHYNPNQTDTDWDGIGDACDDDINGNGKKNPIWIVDDMGKVVLSKWDSKMDLRFLNELNEQNNLGIYIKINQLGSSSPSSVELEAITDGIVNGEIVWDFWDGSQDVWKKVKHTFFKEWIYNIQATALGIKNDAYATHTIVVGKSMLNNHGLQITSNKIAWPLTLEITFNLDVKWDFDMFERSFGDQQNPIIQNINKSITKVFKEQWSYMVTAKWLKNGEVVAVWNIIIAVGTTGEVATKINTNNITPKKEQNVSTTTEIFGFGPHEIKSIERSWGDWYKETTNSLTGEYKYKQAGTYVIVQKIILKNDLELTNFLSLSVRDEKMEHTYSIETIPNKLIFPVFDYVKFEINKKWFLPEWLLLLNSYSNTKTDKIYDNLSQWPKTFEQNYITNWVFFPKSSLFIDECITLESSATIVASNKDICLDAMLNWNINQFHCDMDWDWIPDICDDDIDGDGIPNLIGLIKFELPNCDITEENINMDLLILHNDVCSLDNCPFDPNSTQIDLTNNGRWDQCGYVKDFVDNYQLDSKELTNMQDSDGDWIPDNIDACPLLPETYNGIEDFDGCPEIGIGEFCNFGPISAIGNINNFWGMDIWEDDSFIIEPECFACPCNFSEFANTLNINDSIKAVLRDYNMTTIYNDSIPESIKLYLK